MLTEFKEGSYSTPTVAIKSLPLIDESRKFSGITHDLRSIVGTIKMYCDAPMDPKMAQNKERMPEPVRNFLLSAKKDVDALNGFFDDSSQLSNRANEIKDSDNEKFHQHIIESLLDYSKIIITKIQEKLIPVSIYKDNDLIKIIQRQLAALNEEIIEIPQFMNLDNYQATIESVDLAKLIPKIIDKIRDEIQHQNNHIQVVPSPNPIECLIDQDLTKKIIDNFIFNSIKYTDPNKKSNIIVSFGELNNQTKISVIDFGIGISQENLNKFNDFQPGNNTRFAKEYEGTGFGLYNAASYAIKMGGYIEIKSEGEGKGSTFSLIIPSPLQ